MVDNTKKNIFSGLFEHSIDDKGRVAVPSRLKKFSDGYTLSSLTITRGPERCLYCYTLAEWENVVSHLTAKIESLPFGSAENRAFMRLFVGEAYTCILDKVGRIAIPDNLLRIASIKQNVVFIGNMDHIEIWAKENWDTYFNKNNENFENLLNDLVKKG